MQRHCFVLDLVNEPDLIALYIAHHQAVWPEILKAHKAAGILEIEIYQRDDRLFMIMEVDQSFSFEKKLALDRENPQVMEWEKLMSRFQQPLASAKDGEKWLPMKCIHHFASIECTA
jgi:L-rhamnose mutarotase